MKIAIPLCRQRIAPLFEVAETFLLFNPDHPEETPSAWQAANMCIDDKCRRLFEAGVRVLLCGAVSRNWKSRLDQEGIEVHAFLAGEVPDILYAYLQEGASGLRRYTMPGSQAGTPGFGRRRRSCHRNSWGHYHQSDKE